MPEQRSPADDRAMLALLKSVSRSFYLSARLLPPGLRRPVAVGYLLARTSDSIADAPGLAAADRLSMLQQFDDDVQGRCPPSPIPAPAQMPEAEAKLLGAFVNCIASLEALSREDRDDVLTVLQHITRGQKLDVERFGDATAAGPRSLETDAQLDEYTYLVAGCVGEFWTRLGFRHVPGYSTLPQAEMMDLGRRYGMALQLINVLRDTGEDLANGRRYLPHAADVQPWIARARDGLECGMRYSLSLRNARIRVASALPAIIGARTLALLADAPRGKRAKVPRSDVRALLARTACSFGSRERLDFEFLRATAGWDNRPR
ncbi:MAG TPA: squalene/phytoene synthase family protein [Ramlibacter sp.]|nr:squalene/phytoene synthase family protein [Ramlibacter sp.]